MDVRDQVVVLSLVLVLLGGCSGAESKSACNTELPKLGAALESVLAESGEIVEARIKSFDAATAAFATSSACPPDVGGWVKQWGDHMRATLPMVARATDLQARMKATADASRALIPQMSSRKDVERLKPEMERLKSESARLEAEQAKLTSDGDKLQQQRRDLFVKLGELATREAWTPPGSVAAAIEKSRKEP